MMQNNQYNHPWLEIFSLNETDSTNNEVCLLASDKEMTLVCADSQTQGRGQRGNSWESECGKNLLFSLLIRPDYVSANEQFFLSQAISLAIQQVLSIQLNIEEISIKWPNDIYWRNKKLCGILIENSLTGKHIDQSVIGVGINVNQLVFKSDAPNPVSLIQITGREYERWPLLMQIVAQFHHYLYLLKQGEYGEIIQSYFNNLYRRNGYYPYRDAEGEFEARIVEVEPMGHLALIDRNGYKRRYAFKEVEYIISQ